MTDQPPARCEICNERIPRPVRRPNGRIICVDCFGDEIHAHSHRRDIGAAHDQAYHGGRFDSGEW